MKIQIEIVSDVVCPWCIVGYKKLLLAMHQFQDVEFSISWEPFELNPNMLPDGQDLKEHITEKYGTSDAQSEQTRNHLVQLGQSLDFDFNFSADSKIHNTFKAHQILHYAKLQDQLIENKDKHIQTTLKLKLFENYFTYGKNPNDEQNLVELAVSVGMDKDICETILANQTYANAVRQEQKFWQQQGISAVPAFIFNRQYLVNGAQDTLAFSQTIEAIIDEQSENAKG